MPFFLPSRLVDFEYLSGEDDTAYHEQARGYHYEIDLAFFVVHFGYTKDDYDALTQRERAFILKAWEDKTVQESTLLRNAALNAISNANRGKNKPFRQLWKKQQKPADKDIVRENMRIVREMDENGGKAWLETVRAAYGMEG